MRLVSCLLLSLPYKKIVVAKDILEIMLFYNDLMRAQKLNCDFLYKEKIKEFH